jgi:ATP-dependent Lon protease
MTRELKNKVIKKNTKKQEESKYKKKMNEQSDSDSNDNSSSDDSDFIEEEDEEDVEMDQQEYRKFLSKLFPSKYIDEKVKSGEKQKKKIEVSDDEEEEYNEEEEEEPKKKKNSKSVKKVKNNSNDSKKNKNDKKDNKNSKKDKKDNKKKSKKEESSSDEDDEEDSDYEDDVNNSNKINMVFTIGLADEDEYDEDDSEWEDMDENETEDEDVPVSECDTESDEDEEEDDEEEEEDEVVIKSKKNNKNNKKDKNTKNDKNKKSKDQEIDKDSSIIKISNSENNEEILVQLKEMQEKNKNNPMIDECIKACEERIIKYNKKQEKTNKKQKAKHMRIFKRILRDKNTMNDYHFFETLTTEEQKKIIKELREINHLTRIEKPYRMTLLESDIPIAFKGAAIKKINSLRYMEPGSGEFYKIKNWVDTFMRIPFGNYNTLEVNIDNGVEKCHEFMENAQKTLDDAVYGLNDAKMQIMQMLGQLITNPKAIGTAIAIHGPPGTGKTSLVKEGISKILNRPFAFIALGGATDSSFLEGHSYTYEGSSWGKIVQILIDSKCMNPVIYFDELDKISETPKGEEIAGILTHLTDTSQNNQFHDKYFAEIDFDLSKCLFIFSYNDETKVNPILRDRMYRIQTKGYDRKQKTIISNNYLLPKIREQVKFDESQIIIPDDALHYIIENHCNKEDGVRNLKRCLEIIHTKLNLYRLMKPGTNLFEQDMSLKVEFPFKITKDIVDKLIKKENTGSKAWETMYI